MRPPRVNLEGLFIPPFRVNVKQAPVAKRTERVNREAARLVPRRSKHFFESCARFSLRPREHLKLRKDVDFDPPLRDVPRLPACVLMPFSRESRRNSQVIQ